MIHQVAFGASAGAALILLVLYLRERHAHRRTAREAAEAREAACMERARRLAETAPAGAAFVPDAQAFRALADSEVQRAARYGRQVALIVVEPGADVQARALAWPRFLALCRAHLRTSDHEGRLDDGICAALLPEADLEVAQDVAERLRAEWNANGDHHLPAIRVGVTCLGASDDSFDALVTRVLVALQEASGVEEGRVVVAGTPA